jgi:hypothetical protein
MVSFKLIALLVLGALSAIARVVWKWQDRRRLLAVDRGEICVSCDSRAMTVTDGRAHCQDCGDERLLAELSAHRITPKELESLTRGPSKERYWE